VIALLKVVFVGVIWGEKKNNAGWFGLNNF